MSEELKAAGFTFERWGLWTHPLVRSHVTGNPCAMDYTSACSTMLAMREVYRNAMNDAAEMIEAGKAPRDLRREVMP